MDPRASAASSTTAPGEPEGPTISIDGLERSALKITVSGIRVVPPPHVGTETSRFWAYADLDDVRIAEYGPIGVIRATLGRDGADLPLLLLEPGQIAAARRTLEIVWSRLTLRDHGRTAS